jgi:hypothetical protein
MNINKKFLSDLERGFKSKSYSKADDLKSFLINDNVNLVSSLSEAYKSAELSLYKKTVLKEKLFMIMNVNKKSFDIRNYVQSFAAGFMALALVFTSVLDIGSIQTAQASVPIAVSAVSGDVKVVRLGNEMSVYPGFNITQKDMIKTTGGFVEMIFSDKSVLRINSNSEVTIDDLDIYVGKTDSSMSIKKGSVWFNAVGGDDRLSEYNFKTSEMLVEVDDDSVLNVEVNDLFGQVAVFGESAEVNYKTKGQFETSILRKGDLIKVKKEQGVISVVDTVLLADDLEINQRNWYLDNLKKDRLYKESLAETSLLASKDKVKIRPDSLWYPLKEAQRATKLAFTLDPVKKAEFELEIADQKLHEARILKVEGKDDLAKEALDQYQVNVSNALDIASKVESDGGDIAGSTKLKTSAKNLVESQKKELIVDNSEKDDLKDVLLITELKVAEASGEGTKVKLQQLDDKIDELNKVGADLITDAESIEVKKQELDQVVVDFKEVVIEASESTDVLDDDISRLIEDSALDLSEIVEEEDAPVLKDAVKQAVGIDLNVLDSENIAGNDENDLEQDVVKSKIKLDDLEDEAIDESVDSVMEVVEEIESE